MIIGIIGIMGIIGIIGIMLLEKKKLKRRSQ